MPVTNTKLFLDIKGLLRRHPEWDDDTIAEYLDLRQRERDMIAVARKDLEAG